MNDLSEKPHMSDYFLIAKINSDYSHTFHGIQHLMRLRKDAPIVPPGYVVVNEIQGKPVYDDDGQLHIRFWGLPRYGVDSTGTSAVDPEQGTTLTLDMVREAQALIEALAPERAPADMLFMGSMSGLRIVKNDMLPEDTLMVSPRLFDLIYASSTNEGDSDE
jgi:hypothetical protein